MKALIFFFKFKWLFTPLRNLQNIPHYKFKNTVVFVKFILWFHEYCSICEMYFMVSVSSV